MEELNALYARLLSVGFLVLRQAIECGDGPWVAAEMEMLHNVPSLIGEQNPTRHRYFWEQERAHYVDWIAASGNAEAKSRVRTYYEPLWREMQPLVDELTSGSTAENGHRTIKA